MYESIQFEWITYSSRSTHYIYLRLVEVNLQKKKNIVQDSMFTIERIPEDGARQDTEERKEFLIRAETLRGRQSGVYRGQVEFKFFSGSRGSQYKCPFEVLGGFPLGFTLFSVTSILVTVGLTRW